LKIELGDETFSDDDTLDFSAFMEKMKSYTGKTTTAAPSPLLYQKAYDAAGSSFAVTLSSQLSGSYESAELGKKLAEEESGAQVHVFDSKSATAGEVLVALEIRELVDAGHPWDKIIASMEDFIHSMKTYFVLENLENLVKNGRMNKIVGEIVTLLNIKPVLGSDGEGNIALFGSTRKSQIAEKLAGLVQKSGRDTKGRNLVITHCNNLSLAEKLKEMIETRYSFKEILIVATRGISSVYANEGGIVMAF
ncbi:MAG: DegV family protein, partial [Coriobacteriia bacterium]|nr:DegV family protein [Coriobacteriia bacterium]